MDDEDEAVLEGGGLPPDVFRELKMPEPLIGEAREKLVARLLKAKKNVLDRNRVSCAAGSLQLSCRASRCAPPPLLMFMTRLFFQAERKGTSGAAVTRLSSHTGRQRASRCRVSRLASHKRLCRLFHQRVGHKLGTKQIQFIKSFMSRLDRTTPKLKFLSAMPEVRRENFATVCKQFENVEESIEDVKRVIGTLVKNVSESLAFPTNSVEQQSLIARLPPSLGPTLALALLEARPFC